MSDTITVQTTIGPLEIEALYREGVFALHESLDDFFGPYTVTHVPTGRSVEFVPTRGRGKALIRALLADEAIDWDFTSLDRPGREAQYARLCKAREAVRR